MNCGKDFGLEICIDSLQSAINAVEAGATQLEVCSALALGGLTPSYGLVELIRSRYPELTLMCMIRCRPGNFYYSENEISVMMADMMRLKEAGASGFVFGFLDGKFDLDHELCRRFLEAAGLPCTLHRAFDYTPDWRSCVDDAARLGFASILTSGQKPTASEAAETLKEICEYGKARIKIMIGSGVNSRTLPKLITTTAAKWFHGSASAVIEPKLPPAPFAMGSADTDVIRETLPDEVRKMTQILDEHFKTN